MNKKYLVLPLLVACSGVTSMMRADSLTSALHQELDRIEAEAQKTALPKPKKNDTKKSDEPSLVFKGENDIKMTLNGQMRIDAVRQWNTETLNSAGGLDRASAMNGRLELAPSLSYGEEKYKTPAIECTVKIRQQYQAGRFDKVIGTNPSTVRVTDAVLEVPGASINATLPWVKNAFVKLYLNSLASKEMATNHFLKVGLFEYALGRGIAYGESYGTPKKYLGIYSGSNNFAPFGVLLSGELVKKALEYELYFARMEEKSADFKQTSARTKTHVVNNRQYGAAGAGISNDVFAGTLKSTVESDRLGTMKNYLFAMYNKALDQKVEMINDSSSKLVTLGTGFDYEKGNFEFGGEIAFNAGAEYLYNIDRNVVTLASGTPYGEQNVVRTYNKVNMKSATDALRDGKPAPIVAGVQSAVNAYAGNVNGATIPSATISSPSLMVNAAGDGTGGAVTSGGTAEGIADYTLANSSTRYRPAYRNNYRGWMGVLDGSYNWKPANLKLSAALGYASGDSNPHSAAREANPDQVVNYHGFVGINENYAGKRVKSVLALDARKMQTPLTADPYERQLFDNSFTDMYFMGVGSVWKCTKRDLELGMNALAFFKDKRSWAVVFDPVNSTAAFGTRYARRFLGVELNVIANWKLLPGLSLIGECAVFLPGPFYVDVKGLPLDGSVVGVIKQQDPTDLMGNTSSAYYNDAVPRLGNDPQVAVNVALQYKF